MPWCILLKSGGWHPAKSLEDAVRRYLHWPISSPGSEYGPSGLIVFRHYGKVRAAVLMDVPPGHLRPRCSEEGCEDIASVKELCHRHYNLCRAAAALRQRKKAG